MTLIVNATFVNGQFQPAEPLQLAEGTEVRLAVTPVEPVQNGPVDQTSEPDRDPLEDVIGICSSGGGLNLARDHDLYLYGQLRIRGRNE